MLIIRKIKEQDNEVLAKIIRQCFHDFNAPTPGTVYEDPTTDDLFTLFQKEKSVLWVAESEDKVVGCCGIFPTDNLPDDYVELVKFYLSSGARGKGIGKMLMEKSLQSAKEMGYKKIYIESLPEFDKAVSIYKKNGFVKLNQSLGNSEHSGCNVWMVKEV